MWVLNHSICSQAEAEESSQTSCLDIELLAQSKSNHIPEKFCLHGSLTEAYLSSLSGTMCEPSAPITKTPQIISNGCEKLEMNLSFVAVSHARISQSQEKAQVSTEKEADYGGKCLGSLSRFCQDSYMWKTHQQSLIEEGCESLTILPDWGMTANGELLALTPAALTITEPDFGWLPTARKCMAKHGICWARADSNHKGNLEDFLAQKYRQTGAQRIRGLSVSASFVTLLMDWPQKWASLKPLETGSAQSWRQRHGEY